jgi:hypothetical protein
MAIDPPVKTKVTVDPDTGARVFNQSWSSEIKKKEPIVRKPVSRDTFVTEKKAVVKSAAKPVAKESIEKTSGVRKFSEVVIPKPAKAIGMEPKAGVNVSKMAKPDTRFLNRMRIEAKQQTASAIQKEKEEALLEKNPGKSLKQIYNKQYREEKRSYRQGERQLHRENQRIYRRDSANGDGSEKQNAGGCPGGCH